MCQPDDLAPKKLLVQQPPAKHNTFIFIFACFSNFFHHFLRLQNAATYNSIDKMLFFIIRNIIISTNIMI